MVPALIHSMVTRPMATTFLPAGISGCAIQGVTRRGKYLLLGFEHGHLMVHLGMSGSLRVVPVEALAGKRVELGLSRL